MVELLDLRKNNFHGGWNICRIKHSERKWKHVRNMCKKTVIFPNSLKCEVLSAIFSCLDHAKSYMTIIYSKGFLHAFVPVDDELKLGERERERVRIISTLAFAGFTVFFATALSLRFVGLAMAGVLMVTGN